MSALLNRQFLVRNLCFMYRLIVASAPLVLFAAERSEGALRDYYSLHYGEELGHDEMLLSDLKALGVSDIPYDYAATQLAGAQYYLIAHHHPALLLGYMSVLEGNSLPMERVEEAEAAHGCTLSTVRHHIEHDTQHARDIQRLRSTLPSHVQAAIDWNADAVRQILSAEAERWLHA